MDLYDALAAAPAFHPNWLPIAVIVVGAVAVIAAGFLIKRAPADICLIVAVLFGSAGVGVTFGAQLGQASADWRDYVSEQVAAYVAETDDLVALSPVTVDGNCAQFLAAEPDGDLVDVTVTWLPQELAPVLDGAELPRDLQTVAVEITPASGR